MFSAFMVHFSFTWYKDPEYVQVWAVMHYIFCYLIPLTSCYAELRSSILQLMPLSLIPLSHVFKFLRFLETLIFHDYFLYSATPALCIIYFNIMILIRRPLHCISTILPDIPNLGSSLKPLAHHFHITIS